MRLTSSRALIGVGVVGMPLLVSGCGGGGVDGWRQEASVSLRTTVASSPFAIDRITLAATAPGDRIVADGVSARVERPDGTSERLDVSIEGSGQTLTVGGSALIPASVFSDAQAQEPADVRVLATVTEGGPGEIAGVTVTVVDPGDTLDVAGAVAAASLPGGGEQSVDIHASPDGTQVTLGGFPVLAPGDASQFWSLNYLTIDGPVFFRDGPTGTVTQIGYLVFCFAVEADGDIVAPATIEATIPTRGVPRDRRVIVGGLRPHREYVWLDIIDDSRAEVCSSTCWADSSGRAVVPDTRGLISAERLSGPSSWLMVLFASAERLPMPGPPLGPGPTGPLPAWQELNVVVLEGGLRFTHGASRSAVEIGRLELGFYVLDDGGVVAPTRIDWALPADQSGRDRVVEARGMSPGDLAQVGVIPQIGRARQSNIGEANAQGNVSLEGAFTRVRASGLSGSDSSIGFFFARVPE